MQRIERSFIFCLSTRGAIGSRFCTGMVIATLGVMGLGGGKLGKSAGRASPKSGVKIQKCASQASWRRQKCIPVITNSLSFANSEFTFSNNLRLNSD
jgi:hypothetical protein